MLRTFAIVAVAVLIALAGLLRAADPANSGDDKGEKVLFEDSFATQLGKDWSWLREDPKAWKIDQGTLVIHTSTGSLWQKENDNHNLLLRTAPNVKDGDFAVEVLVENEPANAFEHAGLVWYVDDDNYAMLNKEMLGGKPHVQLVSETDARPKVGFAQKPYGEKQVWLRMEIAGGKVVGKFRATEKDDWQTLGKCDLPAKGDAKVGLITGFGPKDGDRISRFSRFRIVQMLP